MNTFILVLSLVAGVIGTGLGGMIGAIFADRGDAVTGRVLGFAGGVMTGVVSFEMLPQAISSSPAGMTYIFADIGFVLLGATMIFLLEKALELVESRSLDPKSIKIGTKSKGNGSPFSKASASKNKADRPINASGIFFHTSLNDGQVLRSRGATPAYALALASSDRSGKELLSAGILMLLAIALHNFPEGMAIGAAGASQTSLGAIVAIVIAVHNIPEGMAIGAPLTGGGVKPVVAVALAALAGSATVLGAVAGLLIGSLGPLALSASMAAAGGAMLFVTFVRLFPQATSLLDGKFPSVSALAGMLTAALFVFCV